MSDNYKSLERYFENLTSEQIAYLEILETKQPTYYDTHSTLHHINPLHKQEFLQNHVAYMDGDEIAEFRVSIDRYGDAKYNALGLLCGTVMAYCLYKIGTTPKTSKMSYFLVKGTLLGVFSSGIYMAYEHKRLTDVQTSLFASVMQRKIREKSIRHSQLQAN